MSSVFSRKPSPQECDGGIPSKSIWKPGGEIAGGGGLRERDVTAPKKEEKKQEKRSGRRERRLIEWS